MIVGPDFRFGKGRGGTVEGLRELGLELDFEVHAMDAVSGPGGVFSSTRIRDALARGDVSAAGAMLARVHDVEGVVVHGDHRGRTIGFPTANLDPGVTQLPADGVYAVVARRLDREGDLWRGVANLGVRPTFAAGRSVEVHLFDYDGDLYGARLRVGFAERVRSERRFDGVEALVAQIGADAESARRMLDQMDEERFRWM